MSRPCSRLIALCCALCSMSSVSAQVVGTLPGLATVSAPSKTPQVLGIDEDDQAVREKLKQRINIDWVKIKLNHAVDSLRRELGVDMQLDPEGLEEADVVKDQEIESLSCRDRRGDQVLRLLLGPLHMSYVVKAGVVILTSEEKAAEQLTTRAYNVRDLLEPWPPRGKAAGGPLPVPEGTKVVWTKGSASLYQYYSAANEVIDLITSTVQPDTWTDNGGSGSISIFRGLLIISQTEDLHSDVELLLRQIRAGERSQPGDVILLPN